MPVYLHYPFIFLTRLEVFITLHTLSFVRVGHLTGMYFDIYILEILNKFGQCNGSVILSIYCLEP